MTPDEAGKFFEESGDPLPLTDKQKEIVETLEKYLEMAKKGDLLTLLVAADHVDDYYHGKYVLTGDVYGFMGYVIAVANRALHLQITPEEVEDE
jgi:hypothetical protein